MNYAINLEDLQKIIREKFDKLKELDYKELLKMKIDPKDLHFSTRPIKFESFFESRKYLDYMHDLITYCRLLVNAEERQEVLEQEAKKRGLEPPRLLRSNVQEVVIKGKNLAMRYSMLIIDMISRKHKELYLDYNTFKRENELYEIFILISVKVTQCYFQEKQYQMVEEEIHRLLRSGAFNESRRKNFELEKYKKFPELEEVVGKESNEAMIERLLKRSQLPKYNWNFHYHNQKSDLKPNFLKMKTFEAKNSRSPLMSLVVPSIKFKLNDFEKKRREKISSVPRPRTNLKERIPGLIERELNKGNNSFVDQFNGERYRPVKNLNRSFL